MTGREQLHAALQKRLADGTRQLVLVIGSGLHHHLADHGVSYPPGPNGAGLRDWNSLLQAAATEPRGGAFPFPRHDDPTSTWEGMLAARAGAVFGMVASKHERSLQRRVAQVIEEATPAVTALEPLGRALAGGGWRDIITTNFDRTLDRALTASLTKSADIVCYHANMVWKSRATLHAKLDPARIWHPHGLAGKPVSPGALQLGMVAYSKSVVSVRDQVDSYRAALQRWRTIRHGGPPPRRWDPGEPEAWAEQLRAHRTDATWIDQVMSSDLAFIGCGLDRAEADLWLMLHERQRQLARVDPAVRPRAFFIHPLSRFPAHLTTAPADLTPVVTRTHDEAWELILGRWWEGAVGSTAAPAPEAG
jgi:hypothetical protein